MNWQCKKCNATCESKCPDARTIFHDNALVDILSWLVQVDQRPTGSAGNEGVQTTITLRLRNEDNAVEWLKNRLDKPDTYGAIQTLACQHDWRLLPSAYNTTHQCEIDHVHKTLEEE